MLTCDDTNVDGPLVCVLNSIIDEVLDDLTEVLGIATTTTTVITTMKVVGVTAAILPQQTLDSLWCF